MVTLRPVRLALVLVLALAGCVTADYPAGTATPSPPGEAPRPSATSAAPTPAETPEPAETPALTGIALATIVDGLREPVGVALPDDGSGDLYVIEQAGLVRRLAGGAGAAGQVLDLTDRVGSGGERGLLGLALHPGFAADGRLFVDYTDLRGDTVVSEFRRAADGAFDRGGERVILRVTQPAANHNGGDLHFGPDGMLYIALGDGGGSGSANGRRRDTLLGKILRLDVDAPPAAGKRYAIPPDNPFVGVSGVRPEIWATGLRNPWRFWIDPATGALWIGDVGATDREEIDFAPVGGLDFGWDRMEGSLCHDPAACDETGLVLPVTEYDHGSGCVVVGGVVYGGGRTVALADRYVFGDYCSGVVWTIDPAAAFRAAPEPEVVLETGRSIVAFALDGDGEILVVDHGGALLRLVPAP